jgi:glycosyltransferase involved in cell wall biosynthesis
MNIVHYIPTFNRPNILQESISTLFQNTEIKPNEVWIIDDGSEQDIKKSILDFSLQNSNKFPINLLIHGTNYGIGFSFERIFNLIRQNDDLDIACIIESDYIWRKDWLKDVIDVFDSCANTIAIAGTDHPDMYDSDKTQHMFPNIMTEFFGSDLKSRANLYKPFDINTSHGTIKIQGVSNSCGCKILHWKRLKNIISKLEENNIVEKNDFWRRMDLAFHKGVTHDTRKHVSDGWMSSTISKYGEMYLELIGADLSTNFPMVSICDYSISQHVCGGGVNGMIAPEGSTFVNSPKWNNNFLNQNPRTLK